MLIVLIVLAVLVLSFIAIYNGLVRLRVQADNAWADIDVQLKRRYDLVPNLVETVKGYAAHESGTLEAVVQARNSAMAAQGPAQKADAENMLSGALRQLFALPRLTHSFAPSKASPHSKYAHATGRHDPERATLLQRVVATSTPKSRRSLPICGRNVQFQAARVLRSQRAGRARGFQGKFRRSTAQ